MVTCQVAHSVFGVRRKIARLRAQNYLDSSYSDLYRRDHLPIDVVISPEREVADATLQRLSAPATFDSESFLDDTARLIGITLDDDCPVVNTPLRQLTELFSTLKAIVVGVRREGHLFVPSPGDQLFVGDDCYLMSARGDVDRTLEIFGKVQANLERVVIIGAGNVGLGVARNLETRTDRARVKVVERSRDIAERAADSLERTIVLNGDGLDANILEEAGIGRADAMLAVTDDDKTNLLAAVRAKELGCKYTICLTNDPTLVPLMGPLDIDAYINPRATTVSSILRHIRHGRVRGVYSIGDAEAEVIEAQVLGTSPISGQKIGDIDFPEGVIVAGVTKNGTFSRPSANLRIEDGDLISIFAMTDDVPEVERLLQVSIDFF